MRTKYKRSVRFPGELQWIQAAREGAPTMHITSSRERRREAGITWCSLQIRLGRALLAHVHDCGSQTR